MKATQIVTIKSFSPMFKGGEEATNIHIINVEEHGFDIVTQKSLYQIGDKALFIQPDFCLSDIPLFADFIAPEGNPNKSRLGKNNRIKAVKFGFTDSKGNKVYSNGILLPLNEVFMFLSENNPLITNLTIKNSSKGNIEKYLLNIDFDTLLNITKYEEPEGKLQGDAKGNLPNGMYKTDETNFNNNYKQLEVLLPCQLVGTVKIDGSSCTVYYKSETEYGICSRSLEKKLYDTEGTIAQDDWVQLGYPILEKLKEHKLQYAVRCEIYGQSLKGSGNKNNFHAKLPKSIAVYGIDDYSSGVCVPLPMKEVVRICNELHLPMVSFVLIKMINSIEQVKETCEAAFKLNLYEGVVIRTYETNAYSGKYMNNEYDSLK
jgi:hypothetical protein